VLDASVVVKVFLDERDSQTVRNLLRETDTDPDSLLLVPDLVFIECANILWKKVRRESYPEDMARRNLADLRSLALASTPTSELMERALEIACAHDITAYDACYVALAELAGVPLLTADDRLAAAVAAAPFEVLTLGG
jgi:predicted nucleic acid-binding protein